MAGKRQVAPKKLAAVEKFVSPQGIKWDGFKVATDGTIKYGAVTINGLAFGFTSEPDLCIFADNTSPFSANEIIGTVKKSGNFSDYEFTFKVTSIIDIELNAVPIDDVRAAILSVPERFKSFPGAQSGTAPAKIASLDWADTAEKLIPFIEAVQGMFSGTQDVKMV